MDEMANVSLKIVRGTEEKGKVDISFSTKSMGNVAAEFNVTSEAVTGYVAADNPEALDRLSEAIGDDGISFILSRDLSLAKFDSAARTQTEESSGEKAVSTSRLYQTARTFLQKVSDLKFRKQVYR